MSTQDRIALLRKFKALPKGVEREKLGLRFAHGELVFLLRQIHNALKGCGNTDPARMRLSRVAVALVNLATDLTLEPGQEAIMPDDPQSPLSSGDFVAED